MHLYCFNFSLKYIISYLWFQPVPLVSQVPTVVYLVLLSCMDKHVNIVVEHVRPAIMYTAAYYIPVCADFLVLLYILIWKTSSIPVIIQRKVNKRNSKNWRKCIIINVNLQKRSNLSIFIDGWLNVHVYHLHPVKLVLTC